MPSPKPVSVKGIRSPLIVISPWPKIRLLSLRCGHCRYRNKSDFCLQNMDSICTNSICSIFLTGDKIFLCSVGYSIYSSKEDLAFAFRHLISKELFLISPCSVLSLLICLCWSSCCFKIIEYSPCHLILSCSLAGVCSCSVRLCLVLR